MPQPYELDLLHADGIRHADLDAGVKVLNELIYECQRSLEAIGYTELDSKHRQMRGHRGTFDLESANTTADIKKSGPFPLAASLGP